MNKKTKALLCQDEICYQRLTASDFAQNKALIRLIHWVKGGAK